MHDLVIRNGRIIDGSGGPATHGDIAVDGETIVAVGSSVGSGAREIDADGRVVTPGFVDTHTHYDAQATWDPDLTPSGWHGVTSVVMGNCGVGFAPAAPDRRDWLIELMEGVEDIPGAALTDGIEWGWETFPEYLDDLQSRRWVLDLGTQVPHGALRAYVMGERALGDTSPRRHRGDGHPRPGGARGRRPRVLHLPHTAAQVRRRRAGARHARDHRRAPRHRRSLRDTGHGVFQAAIHHADVPDSFGWMRELAAVTRGPVVFNLNQPDYAPELWREDLRLLDEAQADGLDVLAQVSGRPVGILESWSATVNPFMLCPTWGLIGQLPEAERLVHLRRDDVRTALTTEVPAVWTDFIDSITRTWDKLYPFAGEADYEPDPSATCAALAAHDTRTPAEIAYDHLMTENGRGLLYFPLFNYTNHNLDHLWELHQHPHTRMGLADAGAHCGTIADGGMPTFMLQFWTRDRVRGDHLPLEWIVHRQTRQTAEMYGLLDRGLIAPGLRADLNVIDMERLGVELPHLAGDLPTGANRYVQRAQGYGATVCRGAVTVIDDEFTGERPGRLLRGPRPDPR
ncbi:MAG: amidohydrolase family protein [Acidimicrobiales bacterium]